MIAHRNPTKVGITNDVLCCIITVASSLITSSTRISVMGNAADDDIRNGLNEGIARLTEIGIITVSVEHDE